MKVHGPWIAGEPFAVVRMVLACYHYNIKSMVGFFRELFGTRISAIGLEVHGPLNDFWVLRPYVFPANLWRRSQSNACEVNLWNLYFFHCELMLGDGDRVIFQNEDRRSEVGMMPTFVLQQLLLFETLRWTHLNLNLNTLQSQAPNDLC